ncbi:SMC-Scp complex subunit ScpB [Anaerococcus sp. Marseille-Q5996]|uniref:SMC-Scp complex subunit ScpB n=1 Tax=Anaerococcus sp. Marseille-Q5996 TaxID=2972769 RepID=UPI0021C76049|nr:SMC-Scp complex subunit ScpB [Anaerococcus sp. Marseille-Q5996]
MDKIYLKGLIEEVLYIWGEPININDLSAIITDADKKQIKIAIDEMVAERKQNQSGLLINNFDGEYQFVTRVKHDKYFSSLVKKTEKKLTSSALETLSIIAYKQPITRAEVDKIRGINSQTTIDNLLDRGLIKENGRLDKIGKPIIYVTTTLFLQYFNISSLEELPEIKELEEEIYED